MFVDFRKAFDSISHDLLLIVWGSVGKTLFEALERIHVRAAKLIYGLDLDTPTTQVLASHDQLEVFKTYLLIQNVMPSI